MIIGVDIGGTNIRIGASSLPGKMIAIKKTSSKEVFTGADSISNLIAFFKNYIASLGKQSVDTIVIGLPSILSRDRRVVVQTPNIPGLNNVPLKAMLEEALDVRVLVEKDVNLLYCNDMAAFNIAPEGINIGVYIGTGIGNAIFINGKPLIGKDGAAGELGHIYTGRKGKRCGCGNEGCTECYAAGRYLVELRDELYPEENISDLFINHGQEEPLLAFVERVAAVTAGEINILNPETIVLGGGVISMKCFPRQLLVDRIHRFVRKPFPEGSLEILFSSDAAENGVRGAIEFGRIFHQNSDLVQIG